MITTPAGIYFDMDNLEEKPLDNSMGDVEDQQLVQSNGKGSHISKENLKWRQFAKIIDRLLFLIFLLSYAIIYIRLIPY